jgi:PKD repeat protein
MKKSKITLNDYLKNIGFLILFFFACFEANSNNPIISNQLINLSAKVSQNVVEDGQPEMIISGNKIHVVWIELESNNYKLYYCRSVDLGKTWETPKLITLFKYAVFNFVRDASNRKLAVDGENVHIAICDMDWGNAFASKVYYFRSTNGGSSFESAKELASKGGDGWFTAIHINAANGKVAIVYKGTPNAKSGLFVLVSNNNGTSFAEKSISANDVKLTDFWYDGNQMIVLYEFAGSDYRAWVAISNDSGTTFAYTKLLNEKGEEKTMRSYNDTHYSQKIAKSGNNIHIVYSGNNGSNLLTTFYALSTNNGQTFGKVTDVNNGLIAGENIQVGMETVVAKNGQVYLSFLSKASMLYLVSSSDNGNTVSEAKNILPTGFSYVGSTWYPGLAFDPTDATGLTIYAYGQTMFSTKSIDGGKTFSQNTRLSPILEYIRYIASDLLIDSNGNKHWISEAQWWEGTDHDIFYRNLSPEPNPGITNKSLSVTTIANGKPELVIVPSSKSLDFDSAMTAEAWVKFDLSSITENYDVSLFAKVNGTDANNDNPNGFQICLRKRFGKMCMNPGIETDKGDFIEWYNWSGEKGIGDTLWHHIAITYDANYGIDNFKTYVDGLLVGKQTATGKIKQGNGLFMIGTRALLNQSSSFQIDDIRLWNRALTQEELLENQIKTLKGNETGLKLFLNFNDSFKDISGNGNDGIPIYLVNQKTSDFNPPIPVFELYQSMKQVSLTNKTQNGKTYNWNFGDGTVSDKGNPVYTYPNAGEYTITLEAANGNSKTATIRKATIVGLDRIEPATAGNGGYVTISVFGGGLTVDNTSVFLRKSGEPDIIGENLYSELPGKLSAYFNLMGKSMGKWDFVVRHNGVEKSINEGFTLVEGKLPEPWVILSGRDVVLLNMWQTYTINYGNSGNSDALGVPLYIVVSNFPGLDVELFDFEVQANSYMKTNYPQILNEIDTLYFVYKDYFGPGLDARIYPLVIPIIEANSSQSVHIRVKSTANFNVECWVNRPMFETVIPTKKSASTFNELAVDDQTKLNACIALSTANLYGSFLSNLTGLFVDALPVGCIYNVATLIYNPFEKLKPEHAKKKIVFNSMIYKTSVAAVSCGVSLAGGSVLKVGWGVCKMIVDINKSYWSNDDCYKAFDPLYKTRKGIFALSSFDPNEMIGPSGPGLEKWIQKTNYIPYTVLFENKKTATAPAHIVTVTDTLDLSKFDISEFGFGNFGWGDSIYTPNGNKLKEFSLDVDMRPGKNLVTRVSGKLDTLKGVVYWEFLSLNPVTMNLEEDPLTGFLPPNASSPQGEGFVSFSIGLKKTLVTNSQIRNKASIVFDANVPIFTNNYLNTLDLDTPQSQVFPLDGNIKSNFTVAWTGSDQGSGIRDYSIYVLENDTILSPWIINTPDITAVFHGKLGSTYKFYSIATDNVSLTEAKPAQYDASTTVTVDVEEFEMVKEKLTVYPIPANKNIKVTLSNAPCGMYVVELVGINGSLNHSQIYDDFEIQNGININVENYNPGQYILKVVFGNKTVSRKIMVR